MDTLCAIATVVFYAITYAIVGGITILVGLLAWYYTEQWLINRKLKARAKSVVPHE